MTFSDLSDAAKQGNVEAQYRMGFAYRIGDGVEENCCNAVHWFYKAAKQGDRTALFLLGSAYENGQGTITDKFEAYVCWFMVKATGTGDTIVASTLDRFNWPDYLSQSEIRYARIVAMRRLEGIQKFAIF